MEKLSEGTFYRNSYFTDNIKIDQHDGFQPAIDNIAKWDSDDQHQLYAESLKWLNFRSDEIDEFCFKAEHMSIKQGIKMHGQKGKDSVMKEIRNLAEKNECFKEVEYDSLSQEMKDRALPLLLFMVMKRNGDIKTRGVANGKNQRKHTDENEVSSPTPDFNSLKYLCAVFAKEGRDTATVDLPGFFLQTKQEEEVLIKLSGAAALLLVESDPDRWKKHLVRENGKWVTHAICDRTIYGTLNAALLSYKKLAKAFKGWGLIMNPCDPCVWNVNANGK